MQLKGKRIVLAITGSIAAYKSAILTRLLIKAGAEVKVLMTTASTQFISPLTLSTLSKNEVVSDFFKEDNWENHVELGLWADAMLVAPASANTLAKMSAGICDNVVLATYLSSKCPVFIAPAMDLDMWAHPSTVNNIKKLQSYGNTIINVGDGELASGLIGPGRLAEPEEISDFIIDFFNQKDRFINKRFLITAGPTYEPIDPVRFIGNHSSGKMGVALAEVLAGEGALVELVLGPSRLEVYHQNIQLHRVHTAEEMLQKSLAVFDKCNGAILAAAVADYQPENYSDKKIKKSDSKLNSIPLKRTPDIAAHLGKLKKNDQALIGFALETNNEISNASKKLKAKNFDFIVLNSLNDKGAGFNHDTNKITIVYKDNKHKKFKLKSKKEVAQDIIDALHGLSTK